MNAADRQPGPLVIAVAVLVLLGGSATAVHRHVLVASGHGAPAVAAERGVASTLRTTTITGRRGAYFVPPDDRSGALPLAVFLHGTGGTGAGMITRTRALAEREKLIVVAPDSVSVGGTWLVEPGTQRVTEDHPVHQGRRGAVDPRESLPGDPGACVPGGSHTSR